MVDALQNLVLGLGLVGLSFITNGIEHKERRSTIFGRACIILAGVCLVWSVALANAA